MENLTDGHFENLIDSQLKELFSRKNEIIHEALKKHDLKLNIEAESKRRFKNFTYLRRGDEETLWYNDGSDEGLRIVTIKFETTFDFSDLNAKVNMELKYW